MNSSGVPVPVLSTWSTTPSPVVIVGIAASYGATSVIFSDHDWQAAGCSVCGTHDVLIGPGGRGGGVPGPQRVEDGVVLGGRLGVAALHPGAAVQRSPEQPHQGEQQGAVRILVHGEVELPVEVGVARIVVGQRAHPVV